MTLKELQQKYPDAISLPKAGHAKCGGTGEYTDRDGDTMPCYCICWLREEDEEMEIAMSLLGEMATRELRRMEP